MNMRLLFAIVIVSFCAGAEEPKQVLRAGAATSNITPWLGLSIAGNMHDRNAAHIHDELHARCLVLDNGVTRLAFAVVDSCMLPRELVELVKAELAREGLLKPDHIVISATHTHEAPTATAVFQSDPDPQYLAFLGGRIADGLRRAVNNLAPARIAWGSGQLPGDVHNRRWFMKSGTIGPNPLGQTGEQVRMNPGVGNPDMDRPAGPTDPEISVLAVQHISGEPMALFANYSLHYVGGEGPNHVSADYYGYFANAVTDLVAARGTEPPFVAMMSNGTSGDCNNINFREASPARSAYEQMRNVGQRAAAIAAEVYAGLTWQDWVPLDARRTDLDLAVRKPTAEEVAAAETTIATAGGPQMTTVEQIYARETVLLAKYPDTMPVAVQAFRIGTLAIAQIPCEVFAEIGLALKRDAPLKPAFTISLANGYNGYLPTPAQHTLGGYETWRARSSYLETNASEKITTTLLQLLTELAQN
jgi:neutral ceramidase